MLYFLRKCPIIHEAAAPECLFEQDGLGWSWIESVFEREELHILHYTGFAIWHKNLKIILIPTSQHNALL